MCILTTRVGPMIQRVQTACQACSGAGTTIDPTKRCTNCKGGGKAKERKVLEVFVDKGMVHGQTIVFSGYADEALDTITGDIVFIISLKEHKVYKRKGADLFMVKNITLMEALGGFKFVLEHMDKRALLISTKDNYIVKPKSVLAVVGEGMPQQKNPFMKGNLYIEFEVVFPKELSAECIEQLGAILGKPQPVKYNEDEVEYYTLEDVDPSRLVEAAQGGEAYDEEEENGQGGRRLQCAQQ
eukprot:GHVL01004193.1.p1 GENE.GHVL01004193.1~~GHVL01004193.1.p1  ORF type:complete len:241 (+),score=45.50 GHVL01004193.1:118-840(+)